VPAITLTDVVKTYPPREKGAAPLTAVDGVSLEIAEGEIFGIIGYSGAGKSTLVRLVNALEPTTSGRIEIDGREITGLRERELRGLGPVRPWLLHRAGDPLPDDVERAAADHDDGDLVRLEGLAERPDAPA